MPDVMEIPEDVSEQPVGGTGYEPAGTRAGFYYAGPVEGEDSARAAWNTGPISQAPVQMEAPDLRGNYLAHRAALDWDAAHSAAQFEREAREAYTQAQTAQQLKAVQAAERFTRQNQIASAVRSGMPLSDAVVRYGAGLATGDMAGYSHYLPAPQARVIDLPGVGKAVQTGARVQFPPANAGLPEGPIKGEQIMDEVGNPIQGYRAVRSRTGVHILRQDNPKSVEPRVSVKIAGENPLSPEASLTGPLSQVRPLAGTNLPVSLRATEAPALEGQRKAVGGYKIGATYKGGLKYLGGDPKDPNSWDHGQ